MTYLTTKRLLELDVRLTDRDREITKTVAKLRLVSGTQLERLFFAHGGMPPSRARLTRGALARLTEMGLLTKLARTVGGARGGSGAYVFEIGAAGERLLAYWRGEGLARTRPAHEPGQRFVAHTLAIAEMYVRLVEAERDQRIEVLAFETEPAAWRRYVGIGSREIVLKPDAFVRIGNGDYEDSWFLEVDLATESSVVLRRQCQAYLSYLQIGREQHDHGVFPRVLWTVPNRARGELLQRVIESLPGEAARLFVITLDACLVDVLAAQDVPSEAAS